MENRITTGTVVALACSAMLAYAAPQNRPHTGAPPGATGAPASRDQKEKQVTTITGCLQQGSSARRFVLIQASGTSVPNGGVGSVGGRAEHGIRYDLVVGSTIDLSKMVGYQVEASGAASTLTRFNATSIRTTGPSC